MRVLAVGDWKSAKAVYEENRVQSAAYADALLANGIEVQRVFVLRLDKETGMPEHVDCTNGWEERAKGFRLLREYYGHAIEPTASRDNGHWYPYKGDLVPSVTTILSVLAKPALVQWSANCVTDYFVDHMVELRNPQIPATRYQQIIKNARTAHRRVSKRALDVGSIVHEAIETHLAGKAPDDLLAGHAQAENAFLAFLEWEKEHKLETLHLEHTVIHPISRYGGTVDWVGYMEA